LKGRIAFGAVRPFFVNGPNRRDALSTTADRAASIDWRRQPVVNALLPEIMRRKSTRREFLQAAARDASPPGGRSAAADQGEILRGDGGPIVMQFARQAMASQFEIRLPLAAPGTPAGQNPHAELALEALEALDALEEQSSFFRPTSELNRINRLAADGPVDVEPELFKLLCLARDIWRNTDGALDLTATPLWQVWGFAARAGSMPSHQQIADALSRVGFQFVELDEQRNTVRFSKPGIQLNLGSVGKGHALDRLAAKLLGGGTSHFLLHGGKSSILARGSELGPSPDCRQRSEQPIAPRKISGAEASSAKEPAADSPDYWTIGIPHPWKVGKRVVEIKLRNRAAGTSSSQFQSFRHKGKVYGHIIDPRTGRPAEGILSATVLAPTAAMADAVSTAFYVMGLEKSLDYARAHEEIGAVLLTHSAGSGDVEIHSAGLEDCEFIVP
jgi:FAD:protein FMN transferase